MIFKELQLDDLQSWYDLRLLGLKTNPEAFGSSYEEESKRPFDWLKERLVIGGENVVFCCYLENQIIGTIGLVKETRPKTKHKSFIWGMYVHPDHRGKGIAGKLVDLAVQHAKNLNSMQIHLCVVTSNKAAVHLYEKFGFKSWGVETNAMKVDDVFYDDAHMILKL